MGTPETSQTTESSDPSLPFDLFLLPPGSPRDACDKLRNNRIERASHRYEHVKDERASTKLTTIAHVGDAWMDA